MTIDLDSESSRSNWPTGNPSRPVCRDDLARADIIFDKHVPQGVEAALRSMVQRAVGFAEWFDFGRMTWWQKPNQRDHETIDGLTAAGLLNLPYPDVVFRVRLDLRRDGSIETDDVFPDSEIEAVLIASQRGIGTPIGVGWFQSEGIRAETLWGVGFTLIGQNATKDYDVKGAEDISSVTRDWLFTLWLILNTLNIAKVVETPSERLNKARVKAGKSPLRPVTRVNAAQYVTALRETERLEAGGLAHDPRSPRMHLRRGHLRHYKADRFAEVVRSKPQWISPVIVNGEAGGDRTGYRVVVK